MKSYLYLLIMVLLPTGIMAQTDAWTIQWNGPHLDDCEWSIMFVNNASNEYISAYPTSSESTIDLPVSAATAGYVRFYRFDGSYGIDDFSNGPASYTFTGYCGCNEYIVNVVVDQLTKTITVTVTPTGWVKAGPPCDPEPGQ
ncbi:hypothetical protein KFE98_16945 [bacterium SCSIO 12741]|nr:hypothetical protein KFE98_16945 [bacterium SCSIO 12741]